ncbi:MAG TPA: NHL repeat-containing protein [Cyclobacteriaceae bacterium]|nr:NHL repeat-containing protein [Cyclobacteriaceae bacterium]
MKTGVWMAILIPIMLGTSCVSEDVRRSNAGPIIDTFAGSTFGAVGDGGPADEAQLGWVTGVALDASGNIYLSDGAANVIRKINSSHVISTVAGKFRGWNLADPNPFAGDGGPATSAKLNVPQALHIDASGNIYISDAANHVLRKVDASGVITTFAGRAGLQGHSGDNGPAVNATLFNPNGIATDAAGNVYFADSQNHIIRKISTDGTITTIAGTPKQNGYTGDGGPATSAKLHMPQGIAIDPSGNIYISDNNSTIRCISTDGIIRTIAGNGVEGFSGDGNEAIYSQLRIPRGLAIAKDGSILVADAGNGRIRRISPEGKKIETIAGNGEYAYTGDEGPAVDASLANPYGVAIDAAGNIYIADTDNAVIRIIRAN